MSAGMLGSVEPSALQNMDEEDWKKYVGLGEKPELYPAVGNFTFHPISLF